EPDYGHGGAWCMKYSASSMLTIETCLVHADSWPYTPSLKRYREVSQRDRHSVAADFGRRLGTALTEEGQPAVVCVEKPYLDGFIEGVAQTIGVPFVLLALNGGDEPLTCDMQARLAQLPCLKACFGNNLHQPQDGHFFRPMPIGITAESLLYRVKIAARPWEERDSRLLMAPMRMNNRLRGRYMEVLSSPCYSHIVRIVAGRLTHEEFLVLLSEHQSVLSPPGRGYDCGRTWQALAVGTVPLVVNEESFDQRLLLDMGPEYIPLPDQLRPDLLEDILAQLHNPDRYADRVEIQYWQTLWRSYLR
ncbi:unnamed protein product, partial [Polarella glacialis]